MDAPTSLTQSSDLEENAPRSDTDLPQNGSFPMVKRPSVREKLMEFRDFRQSVILACDLCYVTYVIREGSDRFLTYIISNRSARFLTLMYAVDILVALPLPQVLAFVIVPKLNDSRIYNAVTAFNFLYIIQYILRDFKTCSELKVVIRDSGILAESAWANLSIFMLASHVIGAFWYLFSIERKATCWVKACKHLGIHCSLYCDDTLRSVTLLHDYCSTNSTFFEFGLYSDALESGVASTVLFQRIFYCFLWGLQNLSSLGQSLKTSTYFWEMCFAVSVAVCGLVLFALLIGNLQVYLLSKVATTKDMTAKRQKIQEWMYFHSFPRSFQRRILESMEDKLKEITVIDVQNVLQLLPVYLRKDIKRYMCYHALTQVPLLKNKNDELLEAFCDYLVPVVYKKNSIIIKEGDPLVEMLFITRGNVVTHTTSGIVRFLSFGDFYGEELLNWMLNSYDAENGMLMRTDLSNFPFSTKTVTAASEIEVFVLRVHDLKNLLRRFWIHFKDDTDVKPWAIFAIQNAVRRYFERKNGRATKLLTEK